MELRVEPGTTKGANKGREYYAVPRPHSSDAAAAGTSADAAAAGVTHETSADAAVAGVATSAAHDDDGWGSPARHHPAGTTTGRTTAA